MYKVALVLLCLVGILSGVFGEQELQTNEVGSSSDEQQKAPLISIRYKLKWDALWPQDSTLEEVSEADRFEYIQEALIEIGYKMKRKHSQKQMTKFEIVSHENELVEAEYPKLRGADGVSAMTDAELKDLALQLFTTGIVNTVNILRDGEQVDIFANAEFRKMADEKLFQAQSHRPMSADEYRLKKEREAKAKKNQEEFEELVEQQRAETEAYANENLEAVDVMEQNVRILNENLGRITKQLEQLEGRQNMYKAQRVAYEKIHGIKDGEERLAKAVEEARQKQAQVQLERSGKNETQSIGNDEAGSQQDAFQPNDEL